MAKCKYCGIEINWQEKGGRWIPMVNGMRHTCREYSRTNTKKCYHCDAEIYFHDGVIWNLDDTRHVHVERETNKIIETLNSLPVDVLHDVGIAFIEWFGEEVIREMLVDIYGDEY